MNGHAVSGSPKEELWREGDEKQSLLKTSRRTILKNTLKDHEKMVYKEIKIQMAD